MDQISIRNFRSALRRFERVLSRQMEECHCCSGLTLAQCHLLIELEDEGPIHIQGLADRMRLDKSTISRTVDGLARIGLVDREPDSEDRRFSLVRLTGQGAAICASIHRVNDEYFMRVFEGIPEARHAEVVRSLAVLAKAMQNTPGPLLGDSDSRAVDSPVGTA